MANPDVQPWTPDPSTAPGTPPVNRAGGERGTNAFPGNSNFNADGTRIAGYMGPSPGLAYFAAASPDTITSGISTTVHEESHRQAETLTVTLAASTTSPAPNAPVTFTATLHPTAADEPSGTVTFLAGATVLGTAPVTAPGDTAAYTDSAGFAAGAHVITARYDGDKNYPVTTSAGVTVTAA